jgi:hippurate hydrolase
MFVAQPAEELGGGAQTMLDDGLFTRFPKPDYGFALHSVPVAAGTVQYRPGVLTSNSDGITITFKGGGVHSSDPSATIDAVLIAARFFVDLQGVVSREKDLQVPGVVTIGAMEGGSADNLIPKQVVVRETIRSFDPATRDKLKEGTARVIDTATVAAAEAGRTPVAVDHSPQFAPLPEPAIRTGFRTHEHAGAAVFPGGRLPLPIAQRQSARSHPSRVPARLQHRGAGECLNPGRGLAGTPRA